MTNEINIAMIADESYLLPTVVALRTLIEKVNADVMYHIHLIMDMDCQNELKKYYDLKCPDNVNITFVLPSFEDDISAFSHTYVSKAALSKFCLAEIFPQFDKMLYVDGDVMFHTDLTQLYDINIENYYAAVVKDMPSYIWGNIGELGLADYFNSGMMLLNLKKMREDLVKDKLFDYKKNEIRSLYMDQDAFNVVFANQVKFISPIYNFISACFECGTKEDVLDFYHISDDDLEHIEIEHMAGTIKPWKDASSDKMIEWFTYVNNNREVAICLSNYQKTVTAQQQDIIKQLTQQQQQLIQQQQDIIKQLVQQQDVIKQLVEQSERHLGMISACEKRLSDAESKISSLDNIFFIRLWRKIRGYKE